MTFERIVDFRGGYDLRSGNPGQNYGIHNMEIMFAVKGPLGAVSITISTGWYPKNVQEEQGSMLGSSFTRIQPWFTDVGSHRKVPKYKGEYAVEHCKLTDGVCYADGTSLWGDEEWKEGFLTGGTDWLWPRMEQLYRHWFEDGECPDLTPDPLTHEKIEASKK